MPSALRYVSYSLGSAVTVHFAGTKRLFVYLLRAPAAVRKTGTGTEDRMQTGRSVDALGIL